MGVSERKMSVFQYLIRTRYTEIHTGGRQFCIRAKLHSVYLNVEPELSASFSTCVHESFVELRAFVYITTMLVWSHINGSLHISACSVPVSNRLRLLQVVLVLARQQQAQYRTKGFYSETHTINRILICNVVSRCFNYVSRQVFKEVLVTRSHQVSNIPESCRR